MRKTGTDSKLEKVDDDKEEMSETSESDSWDFCIFIEVEFINQNGSVN